MNYQIPVYTMEGTLAKPIEVSEALLGKSVSSGALHLVAVALLSHLRTNSAHTKMRGDVAGGGKKPWKQKGTGRARQGSIRSPQWKGGGVVFGPRNTRNPWKGVNEKTKRAVFRTLLKQRFEGNAIAALESPAESVEPKTRIMTKALKSISGAWKTSVETKGKTLMVVDASVDAKTRRMSRNIPNMAMADIVELGTLQLLNYDRVILTVPAANKLVARLQSTK